jgi:hypothetical protein
VRVGGETSLALRPQTCRLFRPAIGIGGKLIAVNSLIEKPCLHGPGCHPFRGLSGLSGFPSIIGCRLRRYFSAPSRKKRLLPFHFGLPYGSRRGLRLRAFTVTLSHCFAGCRGVVSSGLSHPRQRLCRAVVRRVKGRDGRGVFQVRDDEPAPRIGAGLHRTP